MVEFSWIFVYTLVFTLLQTIRLGDAISNTWAAHNAEEEDGFTNPLHPTYYRNLDENNPLFKVEHQGAVLKKHVQALKSTKNKQIDVVFLVDSSASVGANNFRDELKFVKKLLSDFTVDENNTRVALITFSSRSKVIRHVDYISRPSRDQHKCSLLQDDLPRIRYTGGGTYTLGAFREAKKVLRNTRKTATKAVFLITDGFSNGGDPRPEARVLREKGVKIFTFGIRNGNVKELHHMASEPKNETCYILDSFEEFEAMARRALHEDLHSGRYLWEKRRKCGRLCEDGTMCCDEKANCMCGTYTGQYQCVCPAGYYGSGLKDDCIPCPSGTYKPRSIPGSDVTCLPCPDENHVTEPGSTNLKQCSCKTGYRSVNNQKCAVLQCPVLSPPDNGYFVQDKCDSVFNAACGIRCHPGYELHGSSLRICLENGTWTGTKPECRMKTCPPLASPKNGNMICTRDDFSFKTICRFTCDEGYKLVGSRKRSCLAIAFWTGITTRCREITCQPLPEIKDGKILPELCTDKEVWFGITCHMSCHVGYTLVGPHTKLCTPEGTWTPESGTHITECVDTRAPLLFCPPDIETESDAEEDSALLTWQSPIAIDNSGYIPSISAEPAVISPTQFPIGITTVKYTAEDLNKNKASCSFSVIVIDKEPPRIDRCVSPPPFITKEKYANVTWEDPIFSDNSQGELNISATHMPGVLLHGLHSVVYTALDQSGNNNTCTLSIDVKEHKCVLPRSPVNGNRTCQEDSIGVRCQLYCMNGYDFAMPAADEYFCMFDDGEWHPQDKIPFPDCSVGQVSKDATQPATVTFMGQVSCRERRILHRMEQDFEVSVSKRVMDLCTKNAVCNVDEVETTCEEDDDFNVLNVQLERKKRDIMKKTRVVKTKQTKKPLKKIYKKPLKKSTRDESIITFDFMLEGSVDTTGNDTEDRKRQRALMANLQNILKVLQEEAEAGLFNINLGNKRLLYENMIFKNKKPKLKCRQGSILKDNVCVFCPVGTFFNVVSETCESCGQGTYQPKQGTITCLVCPGKTSTHLNNSRSAKECKAQCLPGSFSIDGLEMCETCDIGLYQPEYAQTHCLPCPVNQTTVWRGKRQVSDCRYKCQPGYVSKTGLEPCLPCPKGTYQPEVGMSACFRCPGDGSTKRSGCSDLRDCEGDWDIQSDGFKKGGIGQTQLPAIPVNPCFEKPCKNNGICTYQPPFSFKCKCPAGYGGIICETEIDECKAKPCLHGGTCENKLNDYACICVVGFTGKKCETDIDDCKSAPCKNGGTCQDQPNAYQCNCRPGFKGVDCEIDVNECDSNPCRNKATCVDLEGTFECICAEGFQGPTCELNLDECAAKPCRNNATCSDAANGYRCQCQPGFTGKKCEVDVDECASAPCQNGAKCVDVINAFQCECMPGYGGLQCEDALQSDFNLDFTKAGTTKYARVKLKQDLSQFTVCFWMRSSDTENYGTPFSYATETHDNAITITDYSGFALNVNNEKVVTNVVANDGKWHHICFTWSNNRGTFKIYRDGLPLDNGDNLAGGQTVQGGGWIVIGQEQDFYGGGFSESESFVGELSGVNVWDAELTYTEIEDMLINCDQVSVGNVVAWPDFLGDLKGKLQKSTSSFCKDCPVPQKPSYGEVDYTGTAAGQVSTYTCFRGFELVGRERRKCLVAGEWEDDSPTCERVNCGSPGRIRNGYVRGTRYSFDNRVRYVCYSGFRLVGPVTRYCNEIGFWEGDQPHCEEIACELPELSTNTKVKNPKKKFKPQDNVSFYCTPGNKLFTSHDTVRCQRDGTWNQSVPTCDSVRCRSPPKTDNMEVVKEKLEYAVGDTARYVCSYGYRFSATSQNTKGLIRCLPTGKWEINLPVCEIVTCSEPSYIPNADIIGDERTFLSQIKYSCHEGYKLSGTNILECIESGAWDPRPPVCNPIQCSRPDEVPNARARTVSLKYKSTVLYLCKAGFTIEGGKKRTCQANGTWSGSPPKCLPPSCGRPEDIEHGQYVGEVFEYGYIVEYSCEKGYSIQGLAQRVCQLTGSWTGLPPTCAQIECITPPVINNGYYKGSSFFYLATVEYECDDGYELSGEQNLTCDENRTWVPDVPVCNPVSCPPPEQVQNGQVTAEGLFYGNRAEYTCSEGYDIQGDLSRTCTANGVWSGLAPVCVAITCAQPLEIFNGGYNYTDFMIGSQVSYFCEEGYFLTGEVKRECLKNLTWSFNEPRCDPVLCSDPLSLLNGRVLVTSKQFGSSVTYECDPGFILVGDQIRNCTAVAEWSGEIPQCQPVKCDSPARIISNGRMKGNNFTFGGTVRYECDQGYRSDGPLERTCLADGSWDSPIPVCEIVKCNRPLNIPNGGYDGFVLDYNSTWKVSCRDGYVLIGESERTCLSDGIWSGPEPVCKRVDCGALDPIQFGTVEYDKTTYGGITVFSCDLGYILEGPRERQCQSNRTWSDQVPICEPRQCENQNNSIENGFSISNGSAFGDMIKYQCNKGYTLNGAETRWCSEDGSWTAETPTCDIVACPVPPTIVNGFVQWDNYVYQSEISYSCIDGYRLVGPLQRRCLSSGKWSRTAPICDMIDCGILTAPVNGALELVSTSYTANATYQCDPGFKLIGSAYRTCLESGNWSNSSPVCEMVQCPDLLSPNYGDVDISDYTYGAQVTYSCGIGYELIGSPTRQCLPTGLWSGEEPICTILICPKIEPITDGMVTPSNYTYGETVQFSCDASFELIGDEEITCLPDKTWSGETSPNCTRIECPPPQLLDNGSFNGNNYELGSIITFACDEGFTLIGEFFRICLVSKEWSGQTDPYCERIRCLPPSRIMHGAVNASGYEYGQIIEYYCYEGYILEGNQERVCQVNETWSGYAPVCNPVECPILDDVPNGLVASMDGNTYRDVIEYNCSRGYRMDGFPQRTCLEDGTWTFPQFECMRITCQEITSIPNGNVERLSFEYGAEINFTCDPGFTLVGEAVLMCVREGYWDNEIPVCQKTYCPDPGLIENGIVKGETTEIGSEIHFYCNIGYRIEGQSILTCESDGVWDSETPVCHKVTCPTPVNISNGEFVDVRNTTDFRLYDSITYACDEGFLLIGAETLVCLETGQWSEHPPFCSVISCPPPEAVLHGQYIGANITHGSTLEYVCDSGYELTGTKFRHCLTDGTWDLPAPNCDPIICRQPVEISNGHVTVTSVFYGGIVDYSCDYGYELVGNFSRYCQSTKTWSGEEPYCSMLSCPVPQEVEHATFVTNSFPFDSYNVGTSIEYSCSEDYEILGNPVLECLSNRTWSDEFPVCRLKTCPPLEGFEDLNTTFIVGMIVKHSCSSPGFVLSGDGVRTCLNNGTWTGSTPDCVPIQCPEIHSLLYGNVIGQNRDFLSIISFTCNEGYTLLGTPAIECQHNGFWNDSVPLCFRVQCSAPKSILNGGYSGQTFYAGDKAEFFCNPGFILLGYTISVCQENGTWSTDVPWCEPVYCGDPPPVDHANVVGPSVSTAVGEKKYYVCEEGYDLDGPNLIECSQDGIWLGELPVCREISCGPLRGVLHATTVITRQTLGSRAVYKCNPGYKANGDLTAECGLNGTWVYDPNVSCEPVDCGSPISIPHGFFRLNDTTFGAEAIVICHKGFTLAGGSSIICSERGVWEGTTPVCQRIGCGPSPETETNILSFISLDSLQVTYSCPASTRLVGAPVIVCREDGTWSDVPPICEPEGCRDPPPVNDNNLLVISEPQKISYSCPVGYILNGVSTVVCLQGIWSDDAPTCQRITCGSLTSPVHGEMTSIGHEVGQKVTFTCHQGYIMIGSSTLVCQPDGQWDGTEPLCQPSSGLVLKECTDLPKIPGVITVPQGFGPGDKVSLQCMSGHLSVGSMEAVCQDDQSWSLPSGHCQRVFCGRPVVNDTRNIMLMGRSYYYGDRVVYMCRRGLQPAESPSILQCLEDGTWDKEAACIAQCKFPCLNGGRCIGSNRCKCMTGFGGPRCETAICILPCLNGGRCVEPYKCQCKPGYKGTRCQTALCDPECGTGGRCTRPGKCSCLPGYFPPNCDPYLTLPPGPVH